MPKKNNEKIGLIEDWLNRKMSRRAFLKVSAALGAATAAGPSLIRIKPAAAGKQRTLSYPGSDTVETDPSVTIKRSACLMCHNYCGIQGKIKDGVLIKLDGSPYNPNCYDYKAKEDLVREGDIPKGILGSLCVKGQAGIKTLYDPYRVKQPLKRVGKRGSGKWKAIKWEEAIDEIVEGGDLFGEGHVDGLRAVRDLKSEIGPAESDYLDEAPPGGYGPKANQFIWVRGRNEQKDATKRFVKYSFGSINHLGHTSICEATAKVAHEHTFQGKDHFKPDVHNATYLILIGASWLEANFTMQTLSRWLMQFKERGGKLVVVDPRFTNVAAKADRWIPVKVGTDGALVMGMIRWIIENKRHKVDYLSRPNEKAAANGGYRNWTDATYLVRLDNGKFLTGAEAGLGKSKYVVIVDGKPTRHEEVLGRADLDVETEVNGIACKSVFRLLKESAQEKSIEEYARICGVEPTVIIEVAREFCEAEASAVDLYKGVCQHTNGFSSARAVLMLPILLDRIDRKGGFGPGGGKFKTAKPGFQKEIHPKGVTIDRHKVAYQGKKKRPSRPWYPLASHGVQQEIFPSIKMGYPYKCKALMLYYSNPAYTMPYPEPVWDVLQDRKAIPLFIAVDCWINETTMYADYILPDTTYLERWSIGGLPPHQKTKATVIRQPLVGKVDPLTHDYIPVLPNTKTMEDIYTMIAKKLGLPNYGPDGMGTGKDLDNAFDFYHQILSGGNFRGGLDPEATHVRMAGMFENPAHRLDATGRWLKHPYGKLINIYSEKAATTKHSLTGKNFPGVAKYEPILDSRGTQISEEGYPYKVITHKPVFHTQSRTAENPWLMMLQRENYVEINSRDAQKIGVRTGDYVRLRSPSNPEGILDPIGRDKIKVKVSEHIRPGVVDVPNSFGHWQMGSRPYYVDMRSSGYDRSIGAGWSMNALMRADPVLKDMCLTDPIGGSAEQYYNNVKIEKV